MSKNETRIYTYNVYFANTTELIICCWITSYKSICVDRGKDFNCVRPSSLLKKNLLRISIIYKLMLCIELCLVYDLNMTILTVWLQLSVSLVRLRHGLSNSNKDLCVDKKSFILLLMTSHSLFFYKNSFYKNHKAQNRQILRII